MQERWAVLLREEPSSKDYREAVSSNRGYVYESQGRKQEAYPGRWKGSR